MSEQSWHEARLIPTSGISGATEQERRATSGLLAVMSVVKEFSRAVLGPLGAPAGKVDTYVEVPFQLGDKKVFPDGLIRVTRGSKQWTALVEVKTGRNALAIEQLENYLDVAREHGFDALVTISNEIPAVIGQHPTKVDKRKLRRVELHHVSWSKLLSTAVVQAEHKGVSDPEQAWILRELIRYLEHPRSGALEFDDMGPSWVDVRDSVKADTLRSSDKGITDVTARFDALLRFVSLRLGRELGTEVAPVLKRKEQANPDLRAQTLSDMLVNDGLLEGAIRIPNAIGPVQIYADLRSGRLTAYVDVEAPRTGRPTTRVNWLVRQLKNSPPDLRIEAKVANSRKAGAAELLHKVREDPSCLVIDRTRDIRVFQIAYSVSMGSKGGRGRGTFIDSALGLVDRFYGEVVQQVKPWAAPPPKLRETEQVPDESVASTALSSQDDIRPADSRERPTNLGSAELDSESTSII